MNTFCSHLGLLAALSILAAAVVGWLFFWRFRFRRQGTIPSDPEIVRMLVNLLIFAAFNIGLFLLVILGKLESWQFLCH